MKTKICFITGTRAEFGLLLPLINLVKEDEGFILQIIATGAHLSPEFGLTYREIETAGLRIDTKVDMLLSGDTDEAIAKSVGLGIIGLTDALSGLKPDWVVLLGDRFEAFAAASAAYTLKIPIAHLHGGETTEGALDEGFRHAMTKLSYLHFTSTETYRKRVIQMGESPERVFNVGAIGLDHLLNTDQFDPDDLSRKVPFSLKDPYAVVTFHPATLEDNRPEGQFRQLLQALDEHPGLNLIFTYPNADAYGREIISLLKAYVENNRDRAVGFVNLGQKRYLTALKCAAAVIGNSSSGIIEAPSFGVPTVNIGDRQKGRIKGESVIDAPAIVHDISAAIGRACSAEFQQQSRETTNPYGAGGTAEKILVVLKKFGRICIPQKPFHDL